jgi:hypothetical protein
MTSLVVALLEAARHLGQVRLFGPLLAGNATEALVALGGWDQADQVSREALETAPSDAASVRPLLARAALELGPGDLDAAGARGHHRGSAGPPGVDLLPLASRPGRRP